MTANERYWLNQAKETLDKQHVDSIMATQMSESEYTLYKIKNALSILNIMLSFDYGNSNE